MTTSGVARIADARAQHGHTMFVRTCAREVPTGRGEVWGYSSPENFGNLPDPVLWPYHTEMYMMSV